MSNAAEKQADQYIELMVEASGVLDIGQQKEIRQALIEVPRALFLPEHLQKFAYRDEELKGEESQYISAPSQLLRLIGLTGAKKGMKILYNFAQSGYGPALLGKLGAHVFTIERFGPFAQLARKALDKLSLQNVLISHGENITRWSDQAPFERIVVGKALEKGQERKYFDQLEPNGGRLIAPVKSGSENFYGVWDMKSGTPEVYEFEA